MATYDEPPKWAVILTDLIARAEQELSETEREGAAPTAPAKKTHPPHPVKSEGKCSYE